MRGGMWMATFAAVLGLVACSEDEGGGKTLAPVSDTTQDIDVKFDGLPGDATEVADAVVPDPDTADAADVAPDAEPDVTGDVADPGAELPDVAADAEDVEVDVAPDVVADVAADVVEDVVPDVATDVAPVCTSGQLDRCWIECGQTYPGTCIYADNPPRIPGTRPCVAGQWGECEALSHCSTFNAGPCTNAVNAPINFLCLDGSVKNGKMMCIKPLGASCTDSFYGGWGVTDCPELCTTSADQCAAAGEQRACEVHCDTPAGPVKAGTQTCQEFCGAKVWSVCATKDACKPQS